MKVLHTSDWHLGQVLYGYDREIEQKDFLKQLAQIVSEETPDVMVVSGDVFDTSAPSAAAVKMYTDGLLAVHDACPKMDIIVTSGNHDSPARLTTDAQLWQRCGVKVVGNVYRNEYGTADYDRQLIPIEREGLIMGWVAAVPFCHPSNFPRPVEGEEERQSYYFKHLLAHAKEKNTTDAPVVLMAHLAVSGSNFAGHDNIGMMETVDLSTFGAGYDYLALGHIHRQQTFEGNRARYCGTPIPVSFDEQCEHSVTLVELSGHDEPVITTRNIKNVRPLHTIPASCPLPLDEAIAKFEEMPLEPECYIRLYINRGEFIPSGKREQVAAIAAQRNCRFCTFKIESVEVKTDNVSQFTVEEFREMTPLETAQRFVKETTGSEMSDTLVDLFNQAVVAANAPEK